MKDVTHARHLSRATGGHVMFATNVGTVDRGLRFILGVALLIWFFLDQGAGFWHYAKLFGIVPLATAVFSTCPLYSLLGLSTCPMKKA
jgi:Protein of unknown function (DUF2892)